VKEESEKAAPPKSSKKEHTLFLCIPCKRLFRHTNTLKRHQVESVLHAQTIFDLEQQQVKEENLKRRKLASE